MEETFTEYLIRVREDLKKSKKVDTNPLEENSKFTRRTIEQFNSILTVCSSQNTPETDALETLLDNFQRLATSNNDPNVWTIFGYELGIICAKVLSAIERSEMFEVLFSKLLTVINKISENNCEVWKTIGRQILNVFINKKFSPGYFESILRMYTVTLRNVSGFVLYNFSLQNLHLLKTLSMLVQRVGDFETQCAIMGVVFLHLSNNQNLMTDFFGVSEEDKALFQSLTFDDFEEDCRLFLNALNKPRGGFERRVYSIDCYKLYLGNCFVLPSTGRKVIWVDANKETERVSIKCSNFGLEDQRVIHLPFSEIANVEIKEMEGSCCVTMRTKNLRRLHSDVQNDDVNLVSKSRKDVFEFVTFLESTTKKKKGKYSKTKPLFIDRSFLNGEGLQVNAISSSARPEVASILPDIINLFGIPDEESVIPQTQIKTPPMSSQERKIILETQDSPSFLVTPKGKRTFEDATETAQVKTREPTEAQENFIFAPKEESFFAFDLENKPPGKQKTYGRKAKLPGDEFPNQRVLREQNQPEATSQDCFRQNVKHKKPILPKFNRKKTQKRQPRGGKKKKQSHWNKRLEPLPVVEPKPSLLDPNGYAFQKWLQPTTSERSNFWLRKLQEESKQKTDVFEFSDSDSEAVRKPKRRVVHSKQRYRKQRCDTKRPPLKQMKEFLRRMKKPSPEAKKPSPVASPEPAEANEITVNPPEPHESSLKWNESNGSNGVTKRNKSPEPSSEDESPENQKRDRSEEENSLTRIHVKKKTKAKSHLPGMFLPTIRRRLQKAEDKARQQTNEIIETMNKAVDQVLNHFQRKEGRKISSYLKVAEEASTGLEADLNDVRQRVRRLHRVTLYFKTGCSVSDLHKSMENHFGQIRDAFRDLETKTDAEKKINQIADRLKNLIDSGIEKSMKNEMASRRDQLLRCASILGTEFG